MVSRSHFCRGQSALHIFLYQINLKRNTLICLKLNWNTGVFFYKTQYQIHYELRRVVKKKKKKKKKKKEKKKKKKKIKKKKKKKKKK